VGIEAFWGLLLILVLFISLMVKDNLFIEVFFEHLSDFSNHFFDAGL
jgi:hypothetical protein